MKKTVFKLLLLIFSAKNLAAQPQLVWEKNFGGTKSEFGGNAIPTSDGNWLLSTATASPDGDFSTNFGNYDLGLVKMDDLGGIIWSKNFGGSGVDWSGSLAENADGSFWVVGQTHSQDSIFSMSKGTVDVYLLKISASGNVIFAKTYGGLGNDNFSDFEPTADGGLVFVASSWSNSGSGDVIFNHGDRDCWLLKLNADGQIEWQKSIGGSKHETLCQLEKSKMGGFWLVLRSESKDGDFPQIAGANNTWVLRLALDGTILWKQRVAEESNFVYPKIREDADGNLVLMMGFAKDWRTYLIKFDQVGSKFLVNPISEPFPLDYFEGFEILADGSLLFFGSDFLIQPMLARADFSGNFLWKKTVSTSQNGFAHRAIVQPDNSILLVAQGYPQDSSGLPNLDEDQKLWVMKLDNALPTGGFFAENLGFNIFPNPISDGQPLQIFWGNENSKLLKIEILSLDGRVLQVFEKEKTTAQTSEILKISEVSGFPNAFFVRVSDEKRTAARLVFKF